MLLTSVMMISDENMREVTMVMIVSTILISRVEGMTEETVETRVILLTEEMTMTMDIDRTNNSLD
jgi:hypothetical protein